MALNNTSPSIARSLLDLQGNKQTNQGINTNYQIMGQDPNAQALDVNNPSFVEQAANETIKQANATLQPQKQTPSIARALLDMQQKPKKQSPSIANAILALGKSMSQNTNQGQMINGNYIPNTTIGTSLSGIASNFDELNQRDQAKALEQERYNNEQNFRQSQVDEDKRRYDQNFEEDKDRYKTGLAIDESRYADEIAFRDQGYNDSRLDRTSDEVFRNRQLTSQNQRAKDALNYQKEVVKQKQAVEEAKQMQEQKANELALEGLIADKDTIKEKLENVQPYLGKDKWLSRIYTPIWGTDNTGAQAVEEAETAITNYFGRNIRNLEAYKQGVLTDADFQNAVKGAFNPNVSLADNITNFNAVMRDMAASKGVRLPQELYLSPKDFITTLENENIEMIGD